MPREAGQRAGETRLAPNNLFFVLDEYHQFEDMGHTVHDKQYGNVILQALCTEYENVRLASYEKWDFRVDDIWYMVHTIYIDDLLCSPNFKPMAGRSIAMQVARHNNSNVQCTAIRASGISCKTMPSIQRKNNLMGLISMSNSNGIKKRLATEREADKCGKG